MSIQNIPKFDHSVIKTIPRFDGNPKKLYSFITRIREIQAKYCDSNNPTCIQNEVVRKVVLSKLHDKAKVSVEISNAREIKDIISILISRFSDHRDDTSLCFDLYHMRPKENESVYEFYERFQKLIDIFNNYTCLHVTNKEIIHDRCSRFEKSALALFIANVKQPYNSLLRNRNVSSLEEALRIIKQDDSISHSRNDFDHFWHNNKMHVESTNYQKSREGFTFLKHSNSANYMKQRHYKPNFCEPIAQPTYSNFQPNSYQVNQITQQMGKRNYMSNIPYYMHI